MMLHVQHLRLERFHAPSALLLTVSLLLAAAIVTAGESGGGAKSAGAKSAQPVSGAAASDSAAKVPAETSAARGSAATQAAEAKGQSDKAPVTEDAKAPALEDPPLPRPFGLGESLKFSVQYGPIKAGTAVLSVEGIEKVGDQECYRLVSTAQSHAIFSPVYKVRDRVVSFVDVRHLLTRRTQKALREKDYHLDQSVEWDHQGGKLIYQDGSILDLLPGARDVLGAFYYVRTLPLVVGCTIPVPAHDNKKSYPIVIKVVGEETIDTPLGRFDCLIVEPMLETDGLFRRSGSLKVWMTNDKERLPVMMKSAVKVGAISAVLVEVRRGERREPEYGLHVN